ncbi:MAG: S1 family peptidase [Clostridium sp.]|jgi:hypothetical protein|nr:S1 family peptidase [Clostridium sp.]
MKINFLRKRLLVLFLAVTLVMSMGVSIGAGAADGTLDDTHSVPQVFALQAKALEAYSLLNTTFTVYEDGTITYPDDYAGVWIADYKLHVATTSTNKNNYGELLKDFDCVVFETAEYSVNELDKIRYSIFEVLKKEHSAVSHYVDVVENKINFGFLELDESNIRLSLASLISLSESNIVKDSLPEKAISLDLFVLSTDELIQTEAELRGGMEINRGSSTGPGRSIGVCGTFTTNGTTYNGFVTAGHNFAISGTNQQVYRGGSDFGRVSQLMWQNNASGDWALVRITNSDTISNKIYGSSSSATRNITGTTNDLPKGTAVMKYGMSNGYAEAEVEAQNVSQTDSSNYTINGLTRAKLTTGTSGGGDSGGPYYTQASGGGNSYNFVGVHWGSNVGDGGNLIWFTPFVRFSSSFTVKTS